MDLNSMTKQERSTLAYAETCVVDQGGLMEAIRMNDDDYAALDKMQSLNLLRWGRIKGTLLRPGVTGRSFSHWVELTDSGWALAGQVRRKRSEQKGPFATKVFAAIPDPRPGPLCA